MLTLLTECDVVISVPDNHANRRILFIASGEAKEKVLPYLSALVSNAGIEVEEESSGTIAVTFSEIYNLDTVADKIANGIRAEFDLQTNIVRREICMRIASLWP